MSGLSYLFKSGLFLFLFLILTSNFLHSETRLLYPQEQALKKISNKLSKVVTTYKRYLSEHKNKTYRLKPEPFKGLLASAKVIEKEFIAEKFPDDIKKVKNIKTWITSIKKNHPKLLELYNKGYAASQIEAAKADISNFPNYKADCDRLKKMYHAYKNPRSVFQSSKKALAVVPTFTDEYAFFQNLPTKYALLIKAKKAGKLETWIRTNKKYLDPFKKHMEEYSQKLPSEINSSIDSAASMAKQAKANKKPNFFKGGVRQHLGVARDKLKILTAIKGDEDRTVLAAIKYLNEKQKVIDDAEESLAVDLLASVETPQDVYSGGDKSKLLGLVKSTWKKKYPSDNILGIRFHHANFVRKTSRKWNNSGWYTIDSSFMAVTVIVKKNDIIAMLYPCFINKNHMKSDLLTIGADTKKGSYVIKKMLMKNLKL
ncbi:MAG: hypothetical protein COA79_06065 [Planctomycetota bacterium]|nr:MAG: hypothetical protein COA79_06065 [Planctomycetota bacterium]